MYTLWKSSRTTQGDSVCNGSVSPSITTNRNELFKLLDENDDSTPGHSNLIHIQKISEACIGLFNCLLDSVWILWDLAAMVIDCLLDTCALHPPLSPTRGQQCTRKPSAHSCQGYVIALLEQKNKILCLYTHMSPCLSTSTQYHFTTILTISHCFLVGWRDEEWK